MRGWGRVFSTFWTGTTGKQIRALLSECLPLECKQVKAGDDECQHTGGCITEWCTPCAARAFRKGIKES